MRQRSLHNLLFCAALLMLVVTVSTVQAELRLSGIFSDHMVIQRSQPVTVWGWADKGQQVIVKFDGQTVSTTTDSNHIWKVKLTPLKQNRHGQKISVQCNSELLVIHDVIVGDVWHASGQSNMQMKVQSVTQRLPQTQKYIDKANFPEIRFRQIYENGSPLPQDDLPVRSGWITCSPESVKDFSATAFYFARKIHLQLGVPIGVIDSSRGGTPIEPFIPREAFHSHPTLEQELKLGDKKDLKGIWKLHGGVRARDTNWLPGRLFHSRLAPITQFAVRGTIWYQGESNCGHGEDPRDYQYKMNALINGWRKAMANEKMPFYFVQLPGSGAGAGWPYMREQQRLSCNLPHTGMVVTIDLLDKDIHPPNKIDVGERLARWALARDYGKSISYSGPLFSKAIIEKGKVIVHFSNVKNGLMIAIKDGLNEPEETTKKKLSHFELANSSGKWFPAQAIIQGKVVVVKSKEASNPVAVRYACEVDPQNCHLYNRDGLPASPFCPRSDLFQYDPKLPIE